MPEMMHQSHRPVAGDGLFGLALGGGVHRHQAQFEGMVDHDPSGAEVALDEHEIPRPPLGGQPILDRRQISVDALKVRRHLAPEGLQVLRQRDDAFGTKTVPSVGGLGFGEGVVENDEEASILQCNLKP